MSDRGVTDNNLSVNDTLIIICLSMYISKIGQRHDIEK